VVLVTPVVAFYLLRDWNRIVHDLDSLIPPQFRATARTQLRLVDETLAGFARGQASVCLLLGIGYGGALALAGLPFGFTVGMAAGRVSFIPYLGSMFGLVASVGLALLEFDDPLRIGLVALIFVVGQAVEGNYLTPKLVGERVRLHPVWVIFALFAGGSLLGFLGMLIALPVAAVVGVLVRFLLERYRGSRLYGGASGAGLGPISGGPGSAGDGNREPDDER
jgi:predicted PurR-regulated permease PerM